MSIEQNTIPITPKAKIFSKILYKTNFCDRKGTELIMGTDLLKDNVKKELLTIVVLRLEELYIKLSQHTNPTVLLQKKSKVLFFGCLKKVCEDFLTKKYGYKVTIDSLELNNSLYTKTLMRDTHIVFKVPFYELLKPNSPAFRFLYYPIYNSSSDSFLEALFDNIILEISNCVVYYSLINFSSNNVLRQILYRSKFLSLRNLERFKNNLNWQLYIKGNIERPINLYNNRYEIYVLKNTGIVCRVIYANRSKEIETLKNIPLLTIVVVEIGDFVISRFDETVYFFSKTVRFALTSVLGQAIGLVWRGIIEGLKK